MVKLMYQLVFQRKDQLNAENLICAQSLPPFNEVLLLFFNLALL